MGLACSFLLLFLEGSCLTSTQPSLLVWSVLVSSQVEVVGHLSLTCPGKGLEELSWRGLL